MAFVSAPGLSASDQIKPIQCGILQKRVGRFDHWLNRQRQPECIRIALHAVAKESRRSNPHYGERLSVDDKCPPRPPSGLCQTFPARCGSSSWLRQARLYCHPEARACGRNRREFRRSKNNCRRQTRSKGFDGLLLALAANAHQAAAGLKRREFREARSLFAKLLVLLEGEKAPVILHAAVDAAIFLIADAPQAPRA